MRPSRKDTPARDTVEKLKSGGEMINKTVVN